MSDIPMNPVQYFNQAMAEAKPPFNYIVVVAGSFNNRRWGTEFSTYKYMDDLISDFAEQYDDGQWHWKGGVDAIGEVKGDKVVSLDMDSLINEQNRDSAAEREYVADVRAIR